MVAEQMTTLVDLPEESDRAELDRLFFEHQVDLSDVEAELNRRLDSDSLDLQFWQSAGRGFCGFGSITQRVEPNDAEVKEIINALESTVRISFP